MGRPASHEEIELYINPSPVKKAVRRKSAGSEGFAMEPDNPAPSRKVGNTVYENQSTKQGRAINVGESDVICEKGRMPELRERARDGGTHEQHRQQGSSL